MKTIQFRDFIVLQRGFDLPKYNRDEGEYPVIAATGIHGSHSEFKVKLPGVVTGRSGSLGEVVYVERPYWPLNTTLWVKDFKGNEPRYVYYFLKTLDLKRFNSGAGVPTLNRNHLDTLAVKIHDRPSQQKIAAILSTYDDLIENNLRRIKILEEMAQTIYREWFVKFRFPGHQKVKMVDSPSGKIPEGWTCSTIGEACQSLVDGDWIETKDQGGKDFRLLQVSNVGVGKFIETGNFRHITQSTFKRLNCTEVLPGQILISRMPKPTGRAWLVTEMPWRMITAVDVAILSANKDTLAPLLFVNILNSPEQLELVAKHSTGTTRERISRSALSKLPVMLPPRPLQEKFSDIAEPCYHQITILRRKNNNHRQTRDMLLPKLISGELDVSELDITIPEANA